MFSEIEYLRHLGAMLQARLGETRKNEGGYSTEAVIITALLAALAIAALAIIAIKVTDKANSIQTG